MLKYIPVAIILLAAGPAFAQAGATQSPPAPNSSASGPTPAGSVPAGATTMGTGTAANPYVGGQVGTSTSGGMPATTSAPASGPSAAMSTTVPVPAK